MEQASKLSVAMEIIENEIGKCMVELRNSTDDVLQKRYNNLIEIREEIYKGNNQVIDKMIEKIMREERKND